MCTWLLFAPQVAHGASLHRGGVSTDGGLQLRSRLPSLHQCKLFCSAASISPVWGFYGCCCNLSVYSHLQEQDCSDCGLRGCAHGCVCRPCSNSFLCYASASGHTPLPSRPHNLTFTTGFVFQTILSLDYGALCDILFAAELPSWVIIIRMLLQLYPPFNFSKAYYDITRLAGTTFDLAAGKIIRGAPESCVCVCVRARVCMCL